jgi:hypothetical protein
MARSSSFHPMSFDTKSIEPAQLNETREFIKTTFSNTHIRQYIRIENSEDFLSNEKLLLIGNEGRADPGFLCFLPKKPVQFLKTRLDQGVFLRLRVDQSLFENGTVFIGTFQLGVLVIQDCWLWRGEVLVNEPFSKRFLRVQSFLKQYLIQDPQVSGLDIQTPQFHALADLKQMIESKDYFSIDFIPENPRKRRVFHRLEGEIVAKNMGTVPPQKSKPVPVPVRQQQQHHQKVPPRQAPPPPSGDLIAIAKNIQGLPDTFDLFSYDHKHIGEAAVQEEDISYELREQFKNSSAIPVVVEWNSFLDAYEIKRVAPKGTRVHTAKAFTIMPVSVHTGQDEEVPQNEVQGNEENGE